MNMKKYMHHCDANQLKNYSFLWSEARLIIAAIALFLGGVPPVLKIFPSSWLIYSLLNLSWIVSGVASAYLLYMWYKKGMKLFGKTNHLDAATFFISVVSGINLGLMGILEVNIGMIITTNIIVFVIVGILYLLSAMHLFMRWNESGKKLF